MTDICPFCGCEVDSGDPRYQHRFDRDCIIALGEKVSALEQQVKDLQTFGTTTPEIGFTPPTGPGQMSCAVCGSPYVSQYLSLPGEEHGNWYCGQHRRQR